MYIYGTNPRRTAHQGDDGVYRISISSYTYLYAYIYIYVY